MSEAPENDSLAELRQRLEEIDDAVVVRVLAVLDAAGELHRQAIERIDRLALQIDRNALAIDRLTQRTDNNARAITQLTLSEKQSRSDIDLLAERMGQLAGEISDLKQLQANSIRQADADRAVMLQLLRVMAGQQPNGKREGEGQ